MSDGGKGDKQIPAQVPQEQVTLNWSSTFGPSRLERMLEAERLAKEEEVAQAVTEGLAKFAGPVPISEIPELQAILRKGFANNSLTPS